MKNTARLTEPDARVLKSENVQIRLAANQDGQSVKALVTSAGFNIDLPFDDIYPFWLVAEHEGEIVGCLQVCVSKPIGRLEMLAIKKELSHRVKAVVFLHLYATGINTIKESGASMVSAVISFNMKSFKKILQRYGGFTLATGNLMAKKI